MFAAGVGEDDQLNGKVSQELQDECKDLDQVMFVAGIVSCYYTCVMRGGAVRGGAVRGGAVRGGAGEEL